MSDNIETNQQATSNFSVLPHLFVKIYVKSTRKIEASEIKLHAVLGHRDGPLTLAKMAT